MRREDLIAARGHGDQPCSSNSGSLSLRTNAIRYSIPEREENERHSLLKAALRNRMGEFSQSQPQTMDERCA